MKFLPVVFCCTAIWILFIDKVKTIPFKQNTGARIIGGTSANVGQFPFAAAIHVQTADSQFFCGGALLSSEWVLTAGVCVYNATLFAIQLGSNSLVTDDPNRVTVATSDYVLHPDFKPDTIENDIGLIKFRVAITLTEYIQLIYLPTIILPNDTTVTAIGWGQVSDYNLSLSNNLKYVTAKILSNVECRIVYGDQITDNMACAEGNYNEGTCTGDNGSPLIEYLSRYLWVVGVASFISGNGCESTDPSGYTRIFPYNDWIRNVTSV